MEEATTGDELSPERFIRELWATAPGDWIGEFFLIQYRPTEKDPGAKAIGPTVLHSLDQIRKDWASVWRYLEHVNRTEVRNVHPCVNPRFRRPKKRGKNSDVSHYVAVWVDVDFHGKDETVGKAFWQSVEDLVKVGLPPSIIVESGHGLHAYWLFDKPVPVKDARPVCAGIQDAFKISDSISDPSRVLRMPGTFNLKDPKHPAMCRVIQATYARYPISAFSDYTVVPTKSSEELEDEQVEAKNKRILEKLGTSSNAEIEEIKKGIPESGGPTGGRNQAAAKYAGYLLSKGVTDDKVYEVLREWNQLNSPPLEEAELKTTVESIVKADKENHPPGSRRNAGREESPFFSGKTFLPNALAEHICEGKNIVATPIGDKYKGVYIYIYKDGVYQQDRFGEIEKEAREALGLMATPKRIDDTIDMVLRNKKVQYNRLNHRARELINVKNGMLDWRSGELLPHDPKYLSTIQIDAEYHPEASCPELDRFFGDIFPQDCMPLAEEFIGYLLTPDTSFQKAFIAVGSGGNGKGTFLKIITLLLGEQNISTVDLHTLEEDKFARALTLGKLANIHHDIGREELKSTSVFKTITSGDPITMEEKHKQGFNAKPYARLVFSANEFPTSKDKTHAFFRRLIFVEFPKTFFGAKEEVLEYEKKLCSIDTFMPALLNRAIGGLLRLHKNRKFSVSESSRKIDEKYRRDVDSAYDFFRECCILEEWGWIPRRVLYDKYFAWCKDEGITPMGARNFTNSFRKVAGITEGKTEGVRGWIGVSWQNGTPPDTTKDQIDRLGERSENEF